MYQKNRYMYQINPYMYQNISLKRPRKYSFTTKPTTTTYIYNKKLQFQKKYHREK